MNTNDTNPMPRTVEEYLDQLAAALGDADPALRQDALYDAEEYLRAEIAQHATLPVSEVLARIVNTYGAPQEVAATYLQTEETVARAMRTPRRVGSPTRRNAALRFFGVFGDLRSYSALFYMLLAGATGVFYFAWVMAGLGLSMGLFVLIIGIPFTLLFLGSTRMLSLLEGRIIETFLGVRMPRRPIYPNREKGLFVSIKSMLVDVRTWTTLLYMLLMLPLGMSYFGLAVTSLSVSLSLIIVPFAALTGVGAYDGTSIQFWYHGPLRLQLDRPDLLEVLSLMLLGFLLLTVSLHLYRGIAVFHGHVARGLLVLGSRN
ncbi:MAG: sensor domain-containing protein [Gammaproteobacteria bacterium]|nr:sensor domain-containing protein [Gammaproteobacteria bacterium]